MIDLPHNETTAHEVTDGCWCCSTEEGSHHSHHIVPQNAGGKDGPRVLLCTPCHEGVHDVAKKKMEIVEYNQLDHAKQYWQTPEAINRAGFLAQLILRSEELTKDSANKTIGMSLKLSGEENQILTYWSKRLRLSKEETVKRMIRDYHPHRR